MKLSNIIQKFYKTNADLYQQLQEQRQIHEQARQTDIASLYDRVHHQAAPCFVLSTGRCGTKLLTHLLQEKSSIKAVHVPTPEFTHYGDFAYKNALEQPEVVTRIVDAARYEQIRNAWLLGKKYVETNNRITFFCHALADLFPNSRFIHLVRQPEAFITSGMARDWYSNAVLHDEGRITPEDSNLKQAEKIAWLWNETNRFIEDFKEKTAADRVLTIRSDELFYSAETTLRIFDHLDLVPLERSRIEEIISEPVNKQAKKDVPKEAVTAELLEKFTPLRSRYFD